MLNEENININTFSFETYLSQSEELLRRHNLSKPPQEAYFYIPSTIDLVEYDSKYPHKTLRRIFQSKMSTYLNYEEKMLKELDQEISLYNTKYPDDQLIFPWWYERCEKLRFLQASGYKINKTIKLLKDNIEWRNKLIPPVVTPKVFEILNCGFFYVHGRDYLFRPILVINFDYYKKYEKEYQLNDWLQAIIFIMEYLINHMLIPGQVENWNIITDLGSVSLLFIPSDAKKILDVLQSNYRCRLVKNFIFGMNLLMRGLMGMFKSMLDETAQRKIRIMDKKKVYELFEIINEEQVEQRFGGKAPNVIPGSNRLFPPIFPSDNYNRNLPKNTISEQNYKKLHLSNDLCITNEILLEKWKKEDELKKQSEKENINKKLNKEYHENEDNIKKLNAETNIRDTIIIPCQILKDEDIMLTKENILNEFVASSDNRAKLLKFKNSNKNKKRSFTNYGRMLSHTPDIISSDSTNQSKIYQRPSNISVNSTLIDKESITSTNFHYNKNIVSNTKKLIKSSNIQIIENVMNISDDTKSGDNNFVSNSEFNQKCKIF